MPTYEYVCQLCGKPMSAFVKYEQRLESQMCSCGGIALYRFPTPMIGTEQKRGEGRLIWDEKQVSQDHGKNWRDHGTTGNPGGAGKTMTFDQGRRSGA